MLGTRLRHPALRRLYRETHRHKHAGDAHGGMRSAWGTPHVACACRGAWRGRPRMDRRSRGTMDTLWHEVWKGVVFQKCNWLRVFHGAGASRMGQGRRQQRHTRVGRSEKCIGLRGPAWPKMEEIAGFFGSGSLAALPVHGAAFSYYFKRLARCAKLATSYLNGLVLSLFLRADPGID